MSAKITIFVLSNTLKWMPLEYEVAFHDRFGATVNRFLAAKMFSSTSLVSRRTRR